MNKNVNTKMERVNISLPPMILEKIDTYAFNTGDTRSNLIRRAVTQFIETQDLLSQIRQVTPYLPEMLEQTRQGRQFSLADLTDPSFNPLAR